MNMGQSIAARSYVHRTYQEICPICSFRKNFQIHREVPRRNHDLTRIRSVGVRFTSSLRNSQTRLRDVLIELDKHASRYLNQSRLQLALRGLEQKNGDETIRIAILCVPGSEKSFKRAKELLRLLFADPLKPEEEWEKILLKECTKSVLLKLDPQATTGILKENQLIRELYVSSPVVKGHRLEILLLESDPFIHELDQEKFVEDLLVPTIKTPISSTGKYSVVTMPVHRALILSEGLLGATSILRYPLNFYDQRIITAAIDLKVPDDQKSLISSQFIDISLATQALESFRMSPDNSLLYEKSWFASGLPQTISWLRQGTIITKSGMKLPVKLLVESLVRNASRAIEKDQARLENMSRSRNKPRMEVVKLQEELQTWAYRAHTELRDNLEIAFNGKIWQKLSWWKLFWRVDDVSMIASDLLSQYFLANAEKESIYLAGRIKECGFYNGHKLSTIELSAQNPKQCEISKSKTGVNPGSPQLLDFIPFVQDSNQMAFNRQSWPQDILVARFYLLQSTIPILQTLAQKLVAQTLSISSLTTIFSGLIYISSISFNLYEVGAVAALGIVFSLRRMQKKWEAACYFWEGDVKEEGRKALRNVGGTLNTFLTTEPSNSEDEEVKKAKVAIQKAQDVIQAIENTPLTCK